MQNHIYTAKDDFRASGRQRPRQTPRQGADPETQPSGKAPAPSFKTCCTCSGSGYVESGDGWNEPRDVNYCPDCDLGLDREADEAAMLDAWAKVAA